MVLGKRIPTVRMLMSDAIMPSSSRTLKSFNHCIYLENSLISLSSLGSLSWIFGWNLISSSQESQFSFFFFLVYLTKSIPEDLLQSKTAVMISFSLSSQNKFDRTFSFPLSHPPRQQMIKQYSVFLIPSDHVSQYHALPC